MCNATNATDNATCPRCDGKGHLEGIHYANGVCFMCNGVGTVTINVAQVKAEISDDNARKCEWILAADADAVKGWSYKRLLALRDFAHSYTMCSACNLLYGSTVYDAYFAKFNSEFVVAQRRMLTKYGN